jgi:UDP-glucuronate 4-epimerase
MAGERFLVTGGTGCIGSWVVRNLVRQSAQVVVLTMDDQFQRLKLIQADEEFAEVKFVHGDITNLDLLIKIAQDHQINKVIHLAGLQLPFCKANPSLGAMVNVVGTINIFEMAKHTSIDRVVYASSAAVYGPKTYYPETVLPHNAPFYITEFIKLQMNKTLKYTGKIILFPVLACGRTQSMELGETKE